MKRSVLGFIGFLFFVVIYAQEPKYNAHEAFDPLFYPQSANDYRTGGGEPVLIIVVVVARARARAPPPPKYLQ